MEYLLHVAYCLHSKKQKAKTKQEKDSRSEMREAVQESLHKLSLPVDVFKQGFGTSNTGNLARDFLLRKNWSVKSRD